VDFKLCGNKWFKGKKIREHSLTYVNPFAGEKFIQVPGKGFLLFFVVKSRPREFVVDSLV
jgi:hypothetical protein